MARTCKGRSDAIENVASASAITSRERTILGSVPPAFTDTIGNIENISVGNDYGSERTISGSVLTAVEIITAH